VPGMQPPSVRRLSPALRAIRSRRDLGELEGPASGEWVRVADIHDRMPVILASCDYARWLGEEPDPRGLMRP